MSNESMLYIEIDILVAIYIGIMVVNLWKTREASKSDKAFFTGVWSIGIILITDIFVAAFNGVPGEIMHFVLYIANATYFIFTGIASFACLLYVDYMITDNSRAVDARRIMYSVPSVCLITAVLASFRHNLIFYVDKANFYHRGNIHVVQQIITILYFAVALIYAIGSRVMAKNIYKKSTCDKMIIFTSVPLVGLLLQMVFPGASLIWPFSSISMFIVFSDLQNSQISMDALTGLNNRSRLMRYVADRCDKVDLKHVLSCTILDVDNFRSVNDRYGHAAGDELLQHLADIVKKTVNSIEGSHFIARYTGNSFAIVSYDTVCHTEEIRKTFQEKLEEFNNSDTISYQVSVSLGSVIYEKSEMSPDDLVKEADDEMYKDKAKTKALKHKMSVEDVVN